MESLSKVVIVGQGYVGLPVSMACCSAGFRVLGIDSDERKVSLLASGTSYIEDVSDEDLGSHLEQGNFVASTDYSLSDGFDVAVVTVPTPLKSGMPDLSYIEAAAVSLSPYIKPGATIILESTTYPGTTQEMFIPSLESNSKFRAGVDFFVGYSPERIDPGNQRWNLMTTPKITSGMNTASLEKVNDFYESLGVTVVPVSGTKEAELTKLLENTFRHVNIALINELSTFARLLGVDVWESIRAAGTKPFGFMQFFPGPGVGGHCLPVDPSYLSWAIKERTGSTFKFVELANKVNNAMPSYVVERSAELLASHDISGKRVLLVGIAYKQDTGDVRESPALEIARLLNEVGANVFGLDDQVLEELWPQGIMRIRETATLHFDLTIVLVRHSNADLEFIRHLGTPILDCRNSLGWDGVSIL
jgi:nucleotide sugar dehydrogenase